jgi:hypothetical protein
MRAIKNLYWRATLKRYNEGVDVGWQNGFRAGREHSEKLNQAIGRNEERMLLLRAIEEGWVDNGFGQFIFIKDLLDIIEEQRNG